MDTTPFAAFLDQAWPIVSSILILLVFVALVILIVVLVRLAKTMKNIDKVAETAATELPPVVKKVDSMLDRAELTVDTVNLELLRVDAILEDVETVTGIAGKTADAVNTVTSAPTEIVTSLVERIQGFIGSFRKGSDSAISRLVYPVSKKGSDKGK